MGPSMAVGAKRDKIRLAVVMALAPRDDVCPFQGRRFATDSTAVLRLKQDLALNLDRDRWSAIHRLTSWFQIPGILLRWRQLLPCPTRPFLSQQEGGR